MEAKNLNNQMQNYQHQAGYNNDEIDLYDLVEILVKNRMIIMITTVIVTLGALLGAVKTDRDYKKAEKTRIENINKDENPQLLKLSEVKQELEFLENSLKNAVEIEAAKYTNADGVADIIYLKNRQIIREIEDKREEYQEAKEIYDTSQASHKNKATLILAVGMVLGLFLGIFMAFVKEFIEGYRKREKKN